MAWRVSIRVLGSLSWKSSFTQLPTLEWYYYQGDAARPQECTHYCELDDCLELDGLVSYRFDTVSPMVVIQYGWKGLILCILGHLTVGGRLQKEEGAKVFFKRAWSNGLRAWGVLLYLVLYDELFETQVHWFTVDLVHKFTDPLCDLKNYY